MESLVMTVKEAAKLIKTTELDVKRKILNGEIKGERRRNSKDTGYLWKIYRYPFYEKYGYKKTSDTSDQTGSDV